MIKYRQILAEDLSRFGGNNHSTLINKKLFYEVKNMNEKLLDQAIIFATNAHSGAFRKNSKLPYIVHPLETVAIVSSMTDDIEILAAAVLHDVIEDTPATKEQLFEKFGERVTSLVCAESEEKQNDKPREDTWKQRKQETLDALKTESDIAVKMIILGDKLSNVRSMYAEYGKIGDQLWERFNQKDKKEHAWYYNGIANAVRELSDFTAWREYTSLLDKIFEI